MATDTIGRLGLLKDLNYRAVLESIARHGPQSRVEVASRLGLSRPSVSRVVDALLKPGLLLEGNRVASKAGRRQTLLDINPKAAMVAGFSVRPRHLRLFLADFKGNIIAQGQDVTEANSPESLVQQMDHLLADAISSEDIASAPLVAMTVGITGAWDCNCNRIHAAPNLPYLDGVDLLGMLRKKIKGPISLESVQVDNDVNYAALGEMAEGAARGCGNFYYINLGSGIGGGAIVNYRLHRGVKGFAGEIGYLPIYQNDLPTPLEQLVSRHVLSEYARELKLGDDASNLLEAARQGEETALRVVRSVSRHLAVALCAVITTHNPELIVLGGSVGRYSDVLIPCIEEVLNNFMPLQTTLVGTTLGGDAALLGAVAQARMLARSCLISKALE